LYRNNGDGTFSDVTAKAGVGDDGYGMACLAADYDNDGDADLFVTNYGPNVLYRNNGDGTFSDVTAKAGVAGDLWSVGCTFLDYDRDGFLDLFVANYLDFDPKYRSFYAGDAFPGPLSYPGQPDALYRNRGDGTFEETTRAAGLFNPRGRGMGVAASDFDDDGDTDIFVANDAMENYLYRNNGNGTFTNVAPLTGTGFGQNGEATSAMGPEFGDFDRDGLIDLLVPDMGYGCLYRNTGRGFFEEMSAKTGLAAAAGQYTSWSGNLFDFDGDGRLDIFLTNGDSRFLEPEEDLLLLNRDGRRFVDVSGRAGLDPRKRSVSRGSAIGDIDNDGDLDILVLNLNDTPRLLRNDGGNRSHWLSIRARGTRSNRDAIGTRVRLTAGGVTQVADVRSSSGYLSQGDLRVHFGLGAAAKAERIEIRWPDGGVQVLENVTADRIVTVTEPASD
ncbi:CRTAC1 family protein, partial [uncultured Desulfuromonas sp.]|uniref:CRTAC1 family protein n=1 Tax=uncultured Desulfuromonas sp. TaxID=181013 RepID=UPI00263062A9